MFVFRAISPVLVFAAAIFVSGAAGAAVLSAESEVRIAQTDSGPPVGNDYATKEDIRWLWEQSERRWSELRKEVADFKTTVIILLGGILAALLAMLFQFHRDKEKTAGAKMPGALVMLLAAGALMVASLALAL